MGCIVNPYALLPSIFFQIGNLAGLYDLNNPNGDGSLPANNSALGTLVDLSGNGRNLTIGSNQPTFQTNIFAGNPGLYFNGTNNSLKLATQITLPSNFTALVIFKTQSVSVDGMILASRTNLGGKDQIIRSAFNVGLMYSWNGPPSAYSISITPNTTPNIAIIRQSGGTSVNYRYNNVQFPGASRSNSAVNFGQLGALGGDGPDGGGTPGGWFNGHVSLVALFSTYISDAQCANIETFARATRGVSF